MTPDAEDCETARLNLNKNAPHHGRRILPEGQQLATAWTENEDERPDNTNSPGENRRLLPSRPPVKHKSRLQAGLTLGVHSSIKYPKHHLVNSQKVKLKSKFEKRKKKLIHLLKPPYFIVSVIFIIICIHVCKSNGFRSALEWSPCAWWREPWRLFTYGFVHANVPHLALNALVALTVGWILEREQSWWRVACLWCGGVAGGALGAGALQPAVHVVGASAAVYALLTAHIANVGLRYGHIPLWWFRPLSVLVLGTSEMCWALMRESPPTGGHAAAQASSSQEYVAWAAHALGAAVGVPLAFLVFTGEHHNKPYVVACRVVSILLLVTATVILCDIHYTRYMALDQTNICNEGHKT